MDKDNHNFYREALSARLSKRTEQLAMVSAHV
jgi:hypothetical protein